MRARALLLLTAVSAAFSSVALVVPDASAFVSPGYHSSRARRTLVGTWRVVGHRLGNVTLPVEEDAFIVITGNTMRRSVGGVVDPSTARYEILHEDDTTMDLRAVFPTGTFDVDVLVETPNAITLYVTDTSGDDEERALRLERIEQ